MCSQLAKKRKNADAVRISSTGAVVPPPTPELMTEVAIGIHLAVTGAASLNLDIPQAKGWNDLSDDVQSIWLSGARIAYSVIAIHGGGGVEEIPPDAK